ncbi:hypothetical protein ADK76_18450 [Streptomyces griseoflavus]|uniref:hypothetical protein n=1 Tax=Streptomyces TaxID=1883 RepID=UPI0004C4F8D2|nr:MULTISPECIES: hypothetical protein [Streptomyces]KOG57052.1 hypothetical protein ADK76_18450 [Streptomyces griseoflavus]KOT98638.1 hypothetical protein ADK86_16165 [Streptomyces sp. NRRL F-5755]KWT58502.1 hypothetical protein ADL21_29200 [Streptomyces albus subsp. albus]
MAAADERDRGIHIGKVHGAFAIGDHNTVTHHEHAPGAPAIDAAHEELLAAVRQLREDLARVIDTPQVTLLSAELTDAQEEIETTGRTAPGRLDRLRTALADAGAVTGMLASGAAVGQAVAALLGG